MLLIGLLGVIAVPKAIGLAIHEDAIDDLIALLPTGPDLQLDVEKEPLAKGWFSSAGAISLNYKIAELDPIRILLNFDINHGPILSTAEGLKLGFAYALVTPKISFDNDLLDITSSPSQVDMNISVLADFSRALNVHFSVSPLDESAPNQLVSFEGISGTLVLRGDQSAEAELTLGRIALADAPNNQRIEMLDVSLLARTANVNSATAPAAIEFTLPSISSPNLLTIEGLSFTSSITQQVPSNRITLRQAAKLGATSGDIPLKSGSWHFELSDIDAESFTQFYSLAARLQLLQNESSTSAIRESSELTQRLALLLLNNSLTFTSAFNADAYSGVHTGELRLSYQGIPQLRNLMGLDLRQAVAASSFSANIDLDLDAISRSPARDMIDPMVRDGYFVENNWLLTLNATLQNSIVQINGEETPAERFF